MNYTFDCYERLRNGAPARRGCALKDEYEDIWIVNVPILLPGGVTRNVQLLIFVFGKECTLSTEQPNLIFYFDVIACCVWLSIISGNKSYEFIINIIASRIIAFYLRMIHESYHEYQCLQSKSSRVRNCSRIVSGVLFFSFAIERELRYTHFRSRVARWKRGTREMSLLKYQSEGMRSRWPPASSLEIMPICKSEPALLYAGEFSTRDFQLQ